MKDDGELAAMTRGAALADGAIAHARPVLRCGMTEHELAWGIREVDAGHGSGPVPFGIIVASGPNAALPHRDTRRAIVRCGRPQRHRSRSDLGWLLSDLTRTLFPDHMPPPIDSVYGTVLSAHMAALHGARSV